MKSDVKTISLALQGGGSHGAFTWGVLDRLLDEPRLKVEAITGTSAGSVNAVLFAEGLRTGGREGARKLMQHFWKSLSRASGDWFAGTGIKNPMQETWLNAIEASMSVYSSIISHLFSPSELNPLKLNPLKSLLDESVDFEALRHDCSINLFVCATNVQNGRIRTFEKHEINCDTVLASCCLPKLYSSVKIGDHYYWDGGYMGNPAIFPLFYKCSSEDILIIQINPICREKVPSSAIEIDNRINEISFNSSLLHELRAIEFARRLVKEEWIKPEYRDHFRFDDMRLHSLDAEQYVKQWSASSKFNMHWYFLSELYESGRTCMDNWLAKHYDAIGKHSTIQLRDEYVMPHG